MTLTQQSARLRPFRPVAFGRYTLLSPLATGGMGEIFLARLDGLQGVEKLCVIKKILPHLSSDKDFVERFVNEAKILVKLSHGSIAQVLDVGLHDGDPYIALEYVDGKDLRKVAARARDRGFPLPLTFVLYVMGRVLDALAYAHRKKDDDDQELGLVHRDVSPQNVLISYEGEVKVIDFGLAKSTLNVTKTNPSIILGKFLYMSPEQAKHQTVDRRSDLYAVGLCLYELIAGKNPFDDAPPGELMARVATPNIAPIGQVDPLCPGPVQALLSKALEVEPARRFQTAEEFRGKLMGCLVEIDPSAGPENVSKYMRETFAGEHQAERKLLSGLRDANRVAGRSGPPPRREPGPQTETAVVNLSSVAAQGERAFSAEPTVQSLKPAAPILPVPLSFAPTPRSKEVTAEHKREGETLPGIIVNETQPAISLPVPEVAQHELNWSEPKGDKALLPFEEPTTDASAAVVVPGQPRVVLGTLLDPAPLLPPPPGRVRGGTRPEDPPVLERKSTDQVEVAPPTAKRSRRWIWPLAVSLTLAVLAGVAYFTMHDMLEQLLRPEVATPQTAQPVKRTKDGVETTERPQLVNKMPVPAPEEAAEPTPAPPTPETDLLSPLQDAVHPSPKPPTSAKRVKRPKADAFHRQWAQTRGAYEALAKKHSCEQLGILCMKFKVLESDIGDAGDEAGSRPELQQRMERLNTLIRDRSTRGEP